MNRRNFNRKALALAALAVVPKAGFSQSKKYKIGYQLYSIRDAMAIDPIGTIKALKAMGYEDFETYGYVPDKDEFYGLKSTDFKKTLEDLDLSTTSGHYGFADYLDKPSDQMDRFVDQCIVGAKQVGHKYITWPVMPTDWRNAESYRKLPAILNRVGEQITKSGLGFAYHNHGYEFQPAGAKTCYDLVLENTDPSLVKIQLDMYWVAHSAKRSPSEIIATDPDRFVMWHIKDMDKVTRDYTELGNGSIDYHDVLSKASQKGLEYFYIEQGGNYATDSTQSAKDSITYFKKELKKYLS